MANENVAFICSTRVLASSQGSSSALVTAQLNSKAVFEHLLMVRHHHGLYPDLDLVFRFPLGDHHGPQQMFGDCLFGFSGQTSSSFFSFMYCLRTEVSSTSFASSLRLFCFVLQEHNCGEVASPLYTILRELFLGTFIEMTYPKSLFPNLVKKFKRSFGLI